MSELGIQFVDADESLINRVAEEWGEKAARHIHLKDGYSILALQGNNLIGLISVYWKSLPPPLPDTWEGYIDILEVHKNFRRRGIATRLIDMALERAKDKAEKRRGHEKQRNPSNPCTKKEPRELRALSGE